MFRRSFAVSIIVLAVLIGCTRSDERSTVASGEAPNFRLQDLNGRTVQLSDYKGKPVVLDFWATWCQPCRDSIPAIAKLNADYAGQGLVILAISVGGDTAGDLRAFQKEHGMTYTVLLGNDEVADQYSVRTIPMVVVIDKSGKIVKRFLGSGNEDEIEKTVKQLL